MKATYHLDLTKEELEIVRMALCNASMKQLSLAHKTQCECEERGIEDSISRIHMKRRDEIRAIIARIDEDE